jgi:hypothetical protein
LLIIAWLGGGDLNNRAVAVATLTCGLLAFVFWTFGQPLINYIVLRPWPKWLKVLTVGLSGAIVIETVFWFWEKVIGAVGVSVSSNLLISIALTLPVYIMFLLLFWWIQKKYHYTTSEILVLGGIYQLGAETVMGTMFQGSLVWGLVYGTIGLPIFMIVYSAMMLPLAMLVKMIRPTAVLRGEKRDRYLWGLLPLVGLLPFVLWYFII